MELNSTDMNAGEDEERDDPDTVQEPPKKPRVRKQNKDKPRKPLKRIPCTVTGCSYSTQYGKDLTRHMRRHTGEKPYNCEICLKDFSRYDKLLQHTRIHEGIRPFTCTVPQCSYTCIDMSALKKHIARVHSDKKLYKCQICSYCAKDSNQLNIHTRFHTGDSPYTCTFDECPRAFKTTTDLRRHMRIHSQEKPYCCTACSYATSFKCNLVVHMRQKHQATPSSSSASSDPKSSKSSPMTRQESSPIPFGLACRLCTYKASSIKSFKRHMGRKHKEFSCDLSVLDKFEKAKARISATDKSEFSRRYVCSDVGCGARFVCEKSLLCHMKQHITLHPPPAPTFEVVISAAASARAQETDNQYANLLKLENEHKQVFSPSLNSTTSSTVTAVEELERSGIFIPSTHHQKQASVIIYAEPAITKQVKGKDLNDHSKF